MKNPRVKTFNSDVLPVWDGDEHGVSARARAEHACVRLTARAVAAYNDLALYLEDLRQTECAMNMLRPRTGRPLPNDGATAALPHFGIT